MAKNHGLHHLARFPLAVAWQPYIRIQRDVRTKLRWTLDALCPHLAESVQRTGKHD